MLRSGYKFLTLYGTTHDAFIMEMKEEGYHSPSAFLKFMINSGLPCTQEVVGSNPATSTFHRTLLSIIN
jgi:hypothetical protein